MSAVRNNANGSLVTVKKEEEKGDLPKNLFPDHIDLTDEVTLKTLVSRKYHANKHFQHALAIARLFYEAAPRSINNSFGFNFPLYPESLSYLMQRVKAEVVVELAGASGENGILLAYAGAAQVYVNDIVPEEMVAFRKRRDLQPEEIRNKLHDVEGDCLKLLTLAPQLENRVGLLVCRNLIHFSNDAQLDALFTLVLKTLKPGGRALFTANSIYRATNLSEIVKTNPDATAFVSRVCVLFNYARFDAGRKFTVFEHAEPCSGELVSTEFKASTIYTRKPEGKWIFDKKEMEGIEEQYRGKVQTAIGKSFKLLQETPIGEVRYVKAHFRCFDKRTLEALVKRYGFIVEHLFVTRIDGHLCEEARLNEWGQQVGVIVRAPDAPVAAAAAAANPL